MKTKIRKIGNSLGLTIPSDLIKDCFLNLGDEVDLSLVDGSIIIKKSIVEIPNIPSTPVETMSYEELKNELTQGFELCRQILQSGHEELIPVSAARANDVMNEFNKRSMENAVQTDS